MGIGGFRRALLLGGSSLGLMAASGAAFAQQAAETELAPIVVQGKVVKKKAADPKSDTPLATQTSADDINKKEISNISDLGNTTEPGVSYSKRTDGPVIRGLTGPRVATVVDGIPISYLENYARGSTSAITNADGGANSFDFSSLSALDVLKGADSSKIGSGVLGGALALRTLEPEDLIEEGRNWGALTKATYDSEDASFGGSLAGAVRAGSTSALFQGSYKKGHETRTKGDIDSYGVTRTEPNPADYDQSNLLFKLRHDVEGGHRIGVTAERYNRDAETELRNSWGTAASATYRPFQYSGDEDLTRERVSLDYSYVAPEAGGWLNSAYAKAYWQHLDKSAGAHGLQRGVTPYLRDNQLEDSTFGLTSGLAGSVDAGWLDHQWRVGLDLASSKTSGKIDVKPESVVTKSQADMPTVDGFKLGLYAEDRIAIGDTGFALTPGFRFDWVDYSPKATVGYDGVNTGASKFPPRDRSSTNFSPKLLGTYDLREDVQLFAQWSMAHRSPTASELYLTFDNPVTGYAQLGNSDLKDETGQTIEVGANLGDSNFGGRVSAYSSWYRNFIMAGDFQPYPGYRMGVARFENVDKVRIYGVEASLHKRFDNGILLHGALSYGQGWTSDDEFLSTVAPFKAVAGIGYEQDNWGADLTGVFVGDYLGKSTFIDDRNVKTSYAIANASVWWEPTQIKGMRLQAGVKNIFNTTYYDALAVKDVAVSSTTQPNEYYSSAGRSFTLSVTQKF